MSRYGDDLEDELSDDEPEEVEQASVKRSKASKEPDLNTLHELGFQSGPSVLLVPNKPAEGAEPSWEWAKGEQAEEVPESREERDHNRAAAGSATETALRQSYVQKEQMQELRDQEHAEKQQQRRQTFQQREKRKRDMGQAKRGKNYVEEEKRQARSFGVYSGFD